jgi:hypothetical protein
MERYTRNPTSYTQPFYRSKVEAARYRPGVAQRVPGSLGSQIT